MTFPVVFLLKSFAVFYLSAATVDLVEHITERYGKHKDNIIQNPKRHWINRKPFNCALCLCFWWAIPIWFAPWSPTPVWFAPLTPLYGVPALAGTALLIDTVKAKIGTHFV